MGQPGFWLSVLGRYKAPGHSGWQVTGVSVGDPGWLMGSTVQFS